MWEWNFECTMRAQASYVGVRKTNCYQTDARTKILQFNGTVRGGIKKF